jgi:hypothetical protein
MTGNECRAYLVSDVPRLCRDTGVQPRETIRRHHVLHGPNVRLGKAMARRGPSRASVDWSSGLRRHPFTSRMAAIRSIGEYIRSCMRTPIDESYQRKNSRVLTYFLESLSKSISP